MIHHTPHDMAFNSTHSWSRWVVDNNAGRYWVCGFAAFTQSSAAVVDDFGNLAPVPNSFN